MDAEALPQLLARTPFPAAIAFLADGDQSVMRVLRQNSVLQVPWSLDISHAARSFIYKCQSFNRSSVTKFDMVAENRLRFSHRFIGSFMFRPDKISEREGVLNQPMENHAVCLHEPLDQVVVMNTLNRLTFQMRPIGSSLSGALSGHRVPSQNAARRAICPNHISHRGKWPRPTFVAWWGELPPSRWRCHVDCRPAPSNLKSQEQH
jgi:hypothetical protein